MKALPWARPLRAVAPVARTVASLVHVGSNCFLGVSCALLSRRTSKKHRSRAYNSRNGHLRRPRGVSGASGAVSPPPVPRDFLLSLRVLSGIRSSRRVDDPTRENEPENWITFVRFPSRFRPTRFEQNHEIETQEWLDVRDSPQA